jgi:TolB-like protein/Tfp pilus assembly protein PilF/transcriptional regulator with XRE-family HTH domain
LPHFVALRQFIGIAEIAELDCGVVMDDREQSGATTITHPQNGRLESWKDIAAYLGRDVRTVQRWEKKENLPVHRHLHEKQGSVYAYREELDAWFTASEGNVADDPTLDEADEDIADEAVEEAAEIDEPVPRRSFLWLYFGIAILIAAVGIGLYFSGARRIGLARSGEVRVLVLPLDNLSGDANQLYFSMGMTDEVIAELTKVNPSQIAVIARTTSERMAGKSIKQILKELDVDYVLDGSVLRAGDHLRITVELISARRETHVWANSYEADVRDVIGVQREVAKEIAAEIGARAVNNRPSAPKVNPAAYDAFLRGRYFWNKRGVDSLQKSFDFFREAIRLDPNYAPSYAGMADAFALLGSAQTGALPPNVGFPKAKEAALKAISLDETLAEPHASLAYELLVYERDLPAADKEFRRAIGLNPHYATAHQWFGLWFVAQGKPQEAIASVKRALQEDPLSLPANISLAEAYYFARDYGKAIEQAKRAIELDSDSALAHFNLGRAYYMMKQYGPALEEFKKARASSPYPATLVPIGMVNAAMGERVQAEESLTELRTIGQQRYVPAVYFALIELGSRNKDKVFQALDTAVGERCDYLVFLSQDPMADELRNDPRWKQLIEKVNVKR